VSKDTQRLIDYLAHMLEAVDRMDGQRPFYFIPHTGWD
jgi:hypothetical protein